MDYQINTEDPLIMHIDMNSSFASTEQQANRLLRGKPVGVAANATLAGCVISPSKELKARGAKIGRVRDILALVPETVILPSDPDKYFYLHHRFAKIFRDYSPNVTPLSIDEAVIDFHGVIHLQNKTMEEIGAEIKQRIKDEVGESLTCNVGIGTNRFLAKLAASLHKPDGLDTITHENLRDVYAKLDLMDLCGINTRNKVRLVMSGIYSPLDFLDAPLWKLWKQVFNSVAGYQWHLRLRGWEVDDVSFKRRSYGQQYALHHFTADTAKLDKLMMKLCEKMGRRLRRANKYALGIEVACGFYDGKGWHISRKGKSVLYTTNDLHKAAMNLLALRPGKRVTHLAVSCYGLEPMDILPLSLFDTELGKRIRVADALDECNNRYGEYTVYPARMHGLDNEIVKRVPFHATTDTLSEMYEVDAELVG